MGILRTPNLTRLLFMGALLLGTSFLSAQTIIDDLIRLDTTNSPGLRSQLTAELLVRFLPGPAPEDTKGLLQAYQDNPYISGLFKDPKLRKDLLAQPIQAVLDSVRAGDERTGRIRYRRVYDRAALFNQDQAFDIRWLADEYARPDPEPLEQLPEKAQQAQASLGSSDYVSVLLSGLSDWIQQRAQQEFTVNFMRKLQEKLEEDNLWYLFPASTNLLKNVDVADYRSFLPEARVAFGQDLQSITFNFAEYVRVTGKIAAGDAKLQNLLLIYELLDLSARGLELPEVLGYARGQLRERSFAAEQKVHLSLASALRDSTTAAVNLTSAYERAVRAFRDEGTRLKDDAQRLNDSLRSLRNHELADSVSKAMIRRFSRSELVTASSFNTMFDDESRHFGQATDLLAGKPPYTYWLAAPTLDSFQLLFITDSLPAPDTLRAMGLSMLDAFLQHNPDGDFKVFERLASMAREIDRWTYKFDSLKSVYNRPELDEDYVDGVAEALTGKITVSKAFWAKNLPTEERRNQGFEYLKNLAAAYQGYGAKFRGKPRLTRQLRYLEKVDSTYGDYLNLLERNHPSLTDPANVTIEPPPTQLDRTESLRKQFLELERAFDSFRTTTDSEAYRVFRSTNEFEQILNLGAQLLYVLTAPAENRRAAPPKLAESLLKPEVRQFYQGLLFQSIAQQPIGGAALSPRGLADLGTDFSIALEQLYAPAKDSTTNELGRKLRFLTAVANDILETPLINTPQGLVALDSRPAFREIPSINRRINEVYELTARGEFRQAVVPLLDLVELFRIIPDSTQRMRRLQKRIDRLTDTLARYATFEQLNASQLARKESISEEIVRFQDLQAKASGSSIRRFRRLAGFGAALASAERPEDISAVLEAVAVRGGSSSNKRLYRFNVDLNAYFGGAYGREMLLDTPDTIASQATTFGMFVPVGASVTWKPWKNREWSFSAFFPIIDLGAITAYRSGENAGSVPEVTFQNVLAPGAHFMVNIPRSPFFLGAGVQYGPNERKIGEVNYSAYRAMLTFGIDVPIFSLGRSED
jgi:hypothetical protein